nr:hypothetical protein [Nostoc sp. CmiVER01]
MNTADEKLKNNLEKIDKIREKSLTETVNKSNSIFSCSAVLDNVLPKHLRVQAHPALRKAH